MYNQQHPLTNNYQIKRNSNRNENPGKKYFFTPEHQKRGKQTNKHSSLSSFRFCSLSFRLTPVVIDHCSQEFLNDFEFEDIQDDTKNWMINLLSLIQLTVALTVQCPR